jgi:hypothetical protein
MLALLLALSSVMVTSAGASSSAENMATRCTVVMRVMLGLYSLSASLCVEHAST